jgi:hypothetical protein
MSTSQQAQVSVTVDGQPLGVFDSRSGGGVTAEVNKRRSGGMGPIKSYRALPDYEDVTVSRVFELARDLELYRTLQTRVGKADMVVTEQRLDVDGIPFGRPRNWVGVLQGLTPPEHDSESTEPVMFELTAQVRSVE